MAAGTSRLLRHSEEFLGKSLTHWSDTYQKNMLVMRDVMSGQAVMDWLKDAGLGPLLEEPGASIKREIDAVQRALGITRDQAVVYLRSRLDRFGGEPSASYDDLNDAEDLSTSERL